MRLFSSTLAALFCFTIPAAAHADTISADIVDKVMTEASDEDADTLSFALYYTGELASRAIDDEDAAGLLHLVTTVVWFVDDTTDIDPAALMIPTTVDELTMSSLLDAGYFLEEAGVHIASTSSDEDLDEYDKWIEIDLSPELKEMNKQDADHAAKIKNALQAGKEGVWDPSGDCPENVDC